MNRIASKTAAKASARPAAKSAPSASNHPVAAALQEMLKETYAAYLLTHNYHWNIEGPNFVGLHTLLETQYNDLFQAVDSIAERIRALGEYAMPYHFDALLEKLRGVSNPLAEAQGAEATAQAMVANLIAVNEATVTVAQTVKRAAEQVKDDESFDMMVERIQVHQKAIWMLKSVVK